eukprot:TRINITY_DN100_c0_g1_i1.p1 TRINITY_DN100_c0_g1~~TRINITY_DN100_c0_g1_i1.p1  ORF type:complete len:494 (-),score=266.13 TRINITY_DN100_c0_g1_i1:171-1652(-)
MFSRLNTRFFNITRTNTSFQRFIQTSSEQDLVVIGAGPGGYVAAIKAGQLGLKVTCVEKRTTLGGTCLNVGCIPSKALLNISHKYEEALHAFPKYGIITPQVSIDLNQMMKQKQSSVRGLTSGIEYLFKKNSVSWTKGFGRVTNPNEVVVTSADGSQLAIPTKNILLATGSEPTGLPGIKFDEEVIVSSTGALELKSIPRRFVVIGGGVIGLELGSVWRRLGSEVTVIEYNDKIGAGTDVEIGTEFKRLLEKQNMKFKMSTKVVSVERVGNGAVIVVEPSKGGPQERIETDVVLVSIGRRCFIDNLGIKEIGVKVTQRDQVIIDEHFRTNIPSIRAIGDIVAGPMLAHKAEEEGIAAVENIVNPQAGHVNYNAIPSVIYTHPEIAWVGLTEEQVKEKQIAYKIGRFPFKANSRARCNDDSDGLVKFISDAETDRILGVHIVSSNAGELIAETVLGMEYGASSEDIARTCHAHPTMSEAVKEAAMAVQGKPIHF